MRFSLTFFDILQEGYFCPPGSTEKFPPGNECPVGSECPTGSGMITPCYSGTYQPQNKSSKCLVCPESKRLIEFKSVLCRLTLLKDTII